MGKNKVNDDDCGCGKPVRINDAKRKKNYLKKKNK